MFEKGGRYFIYRHLRPDKMEPFYIGIGTKKTKWKYSRAKTTEFRNNLWWKIVNKNNGDFIVEILGESDNYEYIKQKEKWFIQLYGKIIDKTGILANFTDGGDGVVGFKHSEETKEKCRIASTGKIVSKETREKLRVENLKRIEEIKALLIFYAKNPSKEAREKIAEANNEAIIDVISGEFFDSGVKCAEKFKVSKSVIYHHLNGKSKINKFPTLMWAKEFYKQLNK